MTPSSSFGRVEGGRNVVGFRLDAAEERTGGAVVAQTHTYEELKKKTIAELREIARDLHHEAVQGYTQMNKDHLLPALCKALGIDAHEHHAAHGAIKMAARKRLRELRAKRRQALEAGDHARLKDIRREYHHVNHRLRVDARKSEEGKRP
jgi:hypothetical protein